MHRQSRRRRKRSRKNSQCAHSAGVSYVMGAGGSHYHGGLHAQQRLRLRQTNVFLDIFLWSKGQEFGDFYGGAICLHRMRRCWRSNLRDLYSGFGHSTHKHTVVGLRHCGIFVVFGFAYSFEYKRSLDLVSFDKKVAKAIISVIIY